MTRVLALAGVDREVCGLARHLGLRAVAGSPWPHYRAGALEVACVGLGASRLAAREGHLALPALVVSTGTCGALDPGLAAGGLVVPEVVLAPDGARLVTTALPGVRRHGALLGVAEAVSTPAAKARLWLATGALAVDMESAPVLAWAATRGLAGAVVRAVSDPADRGVAADLAAAVDPDGRVRPLRALRAALGRPGAAAEALALRAGSGAALAAVAAALGRAAVALARVPDDRGHAGREG